MEGSHDGDATETSDGAVKAGRIGLDKLCPPAEEHQFRVITVGFLTASHYLLDLECGVNTLWLQKKKKIILLFLIAGTSMQKCYDLCRVTPGRLYIPFSN